MFRGMVSAGVVTGAILGAAALPGAGLAAGPAAASRASDVKNAARLCVAERGATAESRAAFRVKYGTNANGSNAFGRCVSARAKAIATLRQGALSACLTERGESRESRDAFELKYGAAGNALQACVVVRMVAVSTS